MSIQIEIDFKDNEKAEHLGATWDNELKIWYIPDKRKITDFKQWIPEDSDIIVKNPFLIAINKKNCNNCKKDTTLIALGAEQFIQAEFENEESNEKEWSLEKRLVLFSNITYLPKYVISMIQNKYPFFRYTFLKSIESYFWTNHCIHCNAIQDDWNAHNQPDGAFFPCSPENAETIELIKTDVKHDFPLVGGYAISDSNDLIKKYSQRK